MWNIGDKMVSFVRNVWQQKKPIRNDVTNRLNLKDILKKIILSWLCYHFLLLVHQHLRQLPLAITMRKCR